MLLIRLDHRNVNIDLSRNSVLFDIGVNINSMINFYRLVFKDVIDFGYSSVKGFNYYYTELTEIYMTKGKYIQFQIILWDEHNKLSISCHDYELTLLSEQVPIKDRTL